jgi:hypothetical protein
VIYSDYRFFLLALPDGWLGWPAITFSTSPPTPQELWESIKHAVIEIDAESNVRIANIQKSFDEPKHSSGHLRQTIPALDSFPLHSKIIGAVMSSPIGFRECREDD